MNKNLSLQSKYYFIFSCLYALFHFGNAQTSNNSITERYNKIEKSSDSYPTNVTAINQLLELEKTNIDSIQLSDIYHRYSRFNFNNKDYKQAIINGKKSLEIQKKIKDSLPQSINNIYNNLAYYYSYSGDETNAIKTFKTLIKRSYKDKFTIRAYALGLAGLFTKRGDYYKLIQYLKEAEHSITKQNDSTLNKELYRIYLTFSRVYSKTDKIDHYHKAIEYLQKTEKIITHLSDQNRIENEIIIYNRYGNIYDEFKEYDKATFYYNKALSLSLKLKNKDSLNIAKLYTNLGHNHAQIDKPQIAYHYYQKAIQYRRYHTTVFDNLGDYYLHQKNYELALTSYQKAINYSYKNYDDLDFTKLPSLKALMLSDDKIGVVNDLKDKANAWLQFYFETQNSTYLEHALATISRADELIDNIRSESYEQQSKFFWREKEVDLYILATSICYILNKPEKAFYFMEKSKSLSLLENLTHEEAKKLGGLPETLQEKEYVLKNNILDASQKPIDGDSFTEKDRQSLVFKAKREYEEFLESLEKEYPNYYKYKRKIDLISFKETKQKIIASNTKLVQYILSQDQEEGYGMYIAADKTLFFKIEGVQQLNKDVSALGNLLSRPMFSIQDQQHYKDISFRISKKLFPFINDIQAFKNKHLIIIPDHTLQYLPFETLAVNSDTKNIEESYLINFMEISYLYSMSLSKNTDTSNRSPDKDLVGFAPIHFENHKLADLKRSEKKMSEIQHLFDGEIFIEKTASKSNFIQASNAYKAIHLSTHASSMSDQDPWIAFYDKKLYLNELYFIKNQSDMVILDACKTGIGALQPGEGAMSITRGFFHAGAKSVVSSLWNTNERSSNEIVLNFYNYLKKGVSKSSALRNAKLDYLKTHQGSEISPYFWGALVLHGNTDSIQLSSNSQTSLWIYILVFTLFLLGILYIKKRL